MSEVAASKVRRYMLRNSTDRTVIKGDDGEPYWFSSRNQAKAYRDNISGLLVVSPGPDHRKW